MGNALSQGYVSASSLVWVALDGYLGAAAASGPKLVIVGSRSLHGWRIALALVIGAGLFIVAGSRTDPVGA